MPVFCDFETRSTADPKAVGLANYAAHPDTDLWCVCCAVDGGPVQTWRPGDPVPAWATGDGEIVAHNAAFELAIWNAILAPRYGWPVLRLERVTCTMVRCYAMGLPGSLDGAAAALGLAHRKDKEGHALMLRMARPRSKNPTVWWDDAERIARLIAYCATDVAVEREIYRKTLPLGESETRLYRLDRAINERGIPFDRASVEAALRAADLARKDLDAQMKALTGGAVASCSALAALKDWLHSLGVRGDDGGRVDLAKADIRALLEELQPSHNPNAERACRALMLRQDAGKTSTAKLGKMLDLASADDRIRHQFQYYGAGTGRWAGRGIQPHNFPRNVPKSKIVDRILTLLRAGDWRAVDMIHGPVMDVIASCLRGFIAPAPGNVLVAGDFPSVEGRGVAWFCGEDWKLNAYRAVDAGTGAGLYELAYAKSFNVPVESVKNPSWERQVGKVMELAFGYGGGAGAFRTMGATLGVQASDAQAELFKQNWRAAHPAVRATWRSLENAAIAAVRCPGETFSAGHSARAVRFKMVGSFLWCLLPSGQRALAYAYPKILPGAYGDQLTYFTVPSTNDLKRGSLIDDPANTNTWARVSTYGGSLLENVIQALCRDLLADCMERLESEGIPIVLHVHDEIVCEVPAADAERARTRMQEIMSTVPAWAKDFPLNTSCDIMARYGKA
jgi:DNA polymerase